MFVGGGGGGAAGPAAPPPPPAAAGAGAAAAILRVCQKLAIHRAELRLLSESALLVGESGSSGARGTLGVVHLACCRR